MNERKRPMRWKLLGTLVVLAAIVFAGEAVLILVEEFVELLVDVLHTGFMWLFEKGFGLPYEKAQGRAAWVSVALLIVLALLGAWRLTPWIKRVSGECRQGMHDARQGLADLWRSARWYQKTLYVTGGLIILSGLLMIV